MSEPTAQRLTDFTNVDLSVAKIGAGGFGLVFMGPDRVLGQWMALKTLRPELLALHPHLRDLFLSECLSWIGLWPHANLITTIGATEIDGRIFLILDYAKHGSLRDLLPFNQSFAMRLAWAQHIAAGLLALHTPDPEFLRPFPLIHRDLKPENILVDELGVARITDFGLAAAIGQALAESHDALEAFALVEELAEQMQQGAAIHTTRANRTARFHTRTVGSGAIPGSTRAGMAGLGGVGTIAYMPPEQWIEHGEVGPPADLYAFGLILSDLLAGRHGLADLEAEMDEEGWYQLHLKGAPRPLHTGLADGASQLPREVEQLYQALLAKRPDQRPTAGETLAVLQQAAAQLGEPRYTPRDFFPRNEENCTERWSNWANTCARFGRFEEALAYNDRALDLSPHRFEALNGRGNILANLGRQKEQAGGNTAGMQLLEEAIGWHEKASATASTDAQRARAQSMKAVRLNSLGRYAESEAAYSAALMLDPDNGIKWYNRAHNGLKWARAEVEAGRSAEARRLYTLAEGYAQQAVHLNPNNPDSHHLLSTIRQLRAQLSG